MWVCPHTAGPPLSVAATLAWVPGGSCKGYACRGEGRPLKHLPGGPGRRCRAVSRAGRAAAASQERRAGLCSPCALVGVTQVWGARAKRQAGEAPAGREPAGFTSGPCHRAVSARLRGRKPRCAERTVLVVDGRGAGANTLKDTGAEHPCAQPLIVV